MSSLKVQEVCKIPPNSWNFLLKDSIVHWVREDKYHKFDTTTQVELEPIVLPVKFADISIMVSVDEEFIEVLGSMTKELDSSYVFLISLRTLEVLDTRKDPVRYSEEIRTMEEYLIGGTFHYGVFSGEWHKQIVDIVPLSRHGKNEKIQVPEGYEFAGIIPGDELQYVLLRDGEYLICSPDGTKLITWPSTRGHGTCNPFLRVKDHLIAVCVYGIIVDGQHMIDTSPCLNVRVVSQDHFIDINSNILYRIRDLQDIKVKSCTKRT